MISEILAVVSVIISIFATLTWLAFFMSVIFPKIDDDSEARTFVNVLRSIFSLTLAFGTPVIVLIIAIFFFVEIGWL